MQSSSSSSELQGSSPNVALRILAVIYSLLLGCVIAYVWLVAQDRFVCLSSFKISRQSPTSGDLGLGGLGLPGLTDNGSVDSQIAIGFVNSADLLLDLEKQFKLWDHYAAPETDYFFRLEKDSPLEDRLDFYRDRIYSHFDKETGLTMLTVDTFDPKLSEEIAIVVLKKTENFINQLNQSVADQQLSFIKSEAERSEKNVNQIVTDLLELQNSNNLVNPDEAISASLRAVQELRMDKLRNETLLATLERDSPESPRIGSLKSQLRSLSEQIDVESAKLSGSEKNRLNQVLARYKELELKLDFANRMRSGNAALLEKNRMDAIAQSRFLSILQNPYLPQEALYPRRWYATITILVLGILLFLTLRILILSVFERAD